MKTKNFTRGVTLATISLSALTIGMISAQAFPGEQGQRNGNGRFFSEEQRENFQNMSQEERQAFMQEKRASMKSQGMGFGRQNKGNAFGHRKGGFEKIDHNVENIENGVIITITTEDEDLLEKIKNREHPFLEDQDNVSFQKTELDNGVQLTITSDDSEVVERIQNHKPGMGRHRGQRGGMIGLLLTEEEREQLKDMTQEERRDFMQSKKEAFENLSEEEKEAQKETIKNRMQARRSEWQSMSDEEKESFRSERPGNGQGFGFGRGQNQRGGRFGQGGWQNQ